ncbi:ribonuclease hi [Plakobranchus ocellatus]|uniref:Ribonuclease hi n=1 Tax=Plakobranchus ocellatus TaxID=259542 RepID=A0AAV4C2T7_9GAST|nr:ribonuclease hi [Plakobranchus ocellatus]
MLIWKFYILGREWHLPQIKGPVFQEDEEVDDDDDDDDYVVDDDDDDVVDDDDDDDDGDGIRGNENVDKLAKAALNRTSTSGKLICYSDLKPKINTYIKSVWQRDRDAEGANELHEVLPNLGEDLHKRGEGAGRKLEMAMCRLRYKSVCHTVYSAPKLSSARTLLLRVRAPPPTPWPDVETECRRAVQKSNIYKIPSYYLQNESLNALFQFQFDKKDKKNLTKKKISRLVQ